MENCELRQLALEAARLDFYAYCQALHPKHYKDSRPHLRLICDELQDFIESDDQVLILNAPPRHYKSFTSTNLCDWVIGRWPYKKVMTGSYNETLSETFSKAVRDTIDTIRLDPNVTVYHDIFPGIRIKKGDGAVNRWALEGQHATYLATSPTGTATGFGCFPGETQIQTEKGLISIANIKAKNNIRVLSYDHENDIMRYNKVLATRRLISHEITKIKTTTGRTIRSTEDHRYWVVGKGYVEAQCLLVGDQVKTIAVEQDVSAVRQREGRQELDLPRVLRQEQDNLATYDLLKVRKDLSDIEISARQANPAGVLKRLLHKGMWLQGSKREQVCHQKMPGLRKKLTWWRKILFSGVQEQDFTGEKRDKSSGEADRLFGMRHSVLSTFQPDEILLNFLQKQSTFRKNAWSIKLAFQRRKQLHQAIYGPETHHIGPRQTQMCALRGTSAGNISTSEGWRPAENEPSCTSLRHEQTQQQSRQFNNPLYILPRHTTQDETIIEVSTELIPEIVYDLQIDRDSNFFANGILVHNCDLLIIDDLIKSALEANNASVLDKLWMWFTDTMLSRLEEGAKIIIVMTRWHSLDLAGRALTHFNALGWKVRHVSLKALQDDGSMLCPELLSYQSYQDKTRTMGADIASANYQQIPIDIRGKLYPSFKTYADLPVDDKGRNLLTGSYSYTDTADEGNDWLCQIIFGTYHHEAYVLDVYYTRQPMEVTEPESAKRLTQHKVTMARIESNNGGRGFARAVMLHLEKLKNYLTLVKWFHQSSNKMARILSNATWVMEHIYFPVNWRDRWPEFYEAMTTYQREGKNAHDDGPDTATGVAETVLKLGL